MKWMGKLGKPVSEIPGYGWIAALQLVHGLKLAGPNFSQQKVIDSLNQDTHFDADGMIVPIDWTKQHNDPAGPNGTANQFAGDYQCMSLTRVHDGKFVPVLTQPGKPWVCMVGGPERSDSHEERDLRELRQKRVVTTRDSDGSHR